MFAKLSTWLTTFPPSNLAFFGYKNQTDSFTRYLSSKLKKIDTYKGENSKVRINMLDRNPYNEEKNKIIDPGGVDVLNEDVFAPKKAIEKASNLKTNK